MTATNARQAAAAPDALRDELRDLLVQATEGKFSADEIDPSANFFDYGYVDSLSGVVFLAEIEDRGERRHAGIIDENVDAAEALADGGDEVADFSGIAGVHPAEMAIGELRL